MRPKIGLAPLTTFAIGGPAAYFEEAKRASAETAQVYALSFDPRERLVERLRPLAAGPVEHAVEPDVPPRPHPITGRPFTSPVPPGTGFFVSDSSRRARLPVAKPAEQLDFDRDREVRR